MDTFSHLKIQTTLWKNENLIVTLLAKLFPWNLIQGSPDSIEFSTQPIHLLLFVVCLTPKQDGIVNC